MVIRCPYPDIPIPEVDILTHLFDSSESLSDKPLWINAADTSQYLSPLTALQWIKRLAIGLDRLGVRRSEVVMIVTPNHIFVPIAYLGVAGSCRVFSGANPAYSADGRYCGAPTASKRRGCLRYPFLSSDHCLLPAHGTILADISSSIIRNADPFPQK